MRTVQHAPKALRTWPRRLWRHVPWKKVLLYGGVAMVGCVLAIQLAYPVDRTVPFVSFEGVELGYRTQHDTAETIKRHVASQPLTIYFGEQTHTYASLQLDELGVRSNGAAMARDMAYPWWLRLVPSSIVWAHTVVAYTPELTLDTAAVTAYTAAELGANCHIEPKNAAIVPKNGTLTVVAAERGGTCKPEEVIAAITSADLMNKERTVRIAMDYSDPTIATREAEALRDTATKRLGTTVRLMVGSNVVELPAATVINWLESVEQEGILALRVQLERAATPLNDLLANKVAVAPGTVTITTHDFVEVSRSGGGEGRQLDVAATATNIAAYAMGATEAIEVVTMSVEPRPQYIRSYSASDVGMSALMKNYAEEHPGVYGVSLIELSGQRRRASYEETRQFATASTYKLFVAYSVLRRVETGELQWNEQISGGRTLTKCFDDMIVLSDNPCAEALVKRIGYRPLTAEATALGATRTTFVDTESYKTTAGDLSLFLAQLETGQLPITSEHRTRLIDAMKRNVYRRGIPAGATGVVADKVGFLGSVLHDGAIVYAPSGTYVLSVMTDGSSWGNIAELTREIEKLRTR